MTSRRKKRQTHPPSASHGRNCVCRGTGFVYPGGDSRRNDRPPITRCAGPGVQTSAQVAQLPPPKPAAAAPAPAAPPAPPQPDLFDRARRAAGEREDD